jgi:hypothetical protein
MRAYVEETDSFGIVLLKKYKGRDVWPYLMNQGHSGVFTLRHF